MKQSVPALVGLIGMIGTGLPALGQETPGANSAGGNPPVSSEAGQLPTESGDRGSYVATAADCMSCHVGADGKTLSGGTYIGTPIGRIMSPNITPSRSHGIGNYTRADLERVLRKGRSPRGHLYPAMPYPSYKGMTDADIDALYEWLMAQPAVDREPEGRTDLPFPFNFRFLMAFWNVLENRTTSHAADAGSEVARGQYLVDHLGHCGTCHTPRNGLMGADADRYLAGGGVIDGWVTPNITSHPVSGIGAWGREGIVSYLKDGHAMNAAVAGGPMQEVVYYSTSNMTDDDLQAIAAYLLTVPPLETPGQTQPALLPADRREVPVHAYGQIRQEMAAALARTDIAEPELLYVTQCAACHGVTGQGQPEAYYPPLRNNVDVRRADPVNLIRIVVDGVPSGTPYRTPGMPGFRKDLSNEQIAQVTNYVRATFGGQGDSALTAQGVQAALNIQPQMSFLLRHAAALAWAGIILALAAIAALVVWIMRRRRTRVQEA